MCYDKTWTVFDYIEKDTPVFFDDYQKLMNQYEVFERELAQYFTEEITETVKHFLRCSILRIQSKIYKKTESGLPFFL